MNKKALKILFISATVATGIFTVAGCTTDNNGNETHKHIFTEYVSDNNATCTEDGTKTANCDFDNCTKTDTVTDVGSKLSHTWKNGKCEICNAPLTGEEVTVEQWWQAFDFTAYDNFSVLTIDHYYSTWNTFSFNGDKVSNIWGNYDSTKADPFIVSGEIIASKEGETYFYYERSDGDWTKEEIPEQTYYSTFQNCRTSIVRPGISFDKYTFDSTSGKYSYVNPEAGSTEKTTVIIKDGKLQIVEYTTPIDYEVTFSAKEYSLLFNYYIEIRLPQIEE